jgi:hypothetical protein
MDPNANLQEQERILGAHGRVHELDRQRLAELRAALSRWLSRHGFAPDWDACPRAARHFGHGPMAAERYWGR